MYGFGGLNSLFGGDNNDTYRVDVATDFIFEFADQGTDTVIATLSYTLPETSVEILQLWEWGGSLSGYGNSLDNTIIGNKSANILDGRGGADVLTGGVGAGDHFVFSDLSHSQPGASDVITDFAGDFIDLTQIDANAALSGDQAFTFWGSAAFTGVAGQLRVDGTLVEGDVNGDAVADFSLTVLGSTPVQNDFLL